MLPTPQGNDEIAVAGRHLSRMQDQLQKTLRQQKTLADLGLAVSKINHDMRNILASAQLMSGISVALINSTDLTQVTTRPLNGMWCYIAIAVFRMKNSSTLSVIAWVVRCFLRTFLKKWIP